MWTRKSINPRKTVVFIVNNYKKIKTEFHENTLIYFLKIYLRDNNYRNVNLFHQEKLVKNDLAPLYNFFKDKNEKLIQFHVVPKGAKYPTDNNSTKKENEIGNYTSRIKNNTNTNTNTNKTSRSKSTQKKDKSDCNKKNNLKINKTKKAAASQDTKNGNGQVKPNSKIINENNNNTQSEVLKNSDTDSGGIDIQINIETSNKELEDLCKMQGEEISSLKKEITEARLKISNLENNSNLLTKKNLSLNVSNSNFEIIPKTNTKNNSKKKLDARSLSVISFNTSYTILGKKPLDEPKSLTPCPTKEIYNTNLVPLMKNNNSMKNISISPYQSNNNIKIAKKEKKAIVLIPKEDLLQKNGLHTPENYIKYSSLFNYLSKDELLLFSIINKKDGVCFCYHLLNILNDKINSIIDKQNNLSSKYNELLDTNNSPRSSVLLSHISKSGLKMLANPKLLEVYQNPDLDYFISNKIVLFIYRVLFQFYNKFGDNMIKAPTIFMSMVTNEIKNGSAKFDNYGAYLYDLIDNKMNLEIENVIKVKEIMGIFEITSIEGILLSKIDRTTAYVGYIVKDILTFCGLLKNAKSKDEIKDNEKIEIINEYGNKKGMKDKYMSVFNKIIGVIPKYCEKD